MECLLHVILGPDKGLKHAIVPGPNVVGRGARATMRLTQEDVSYEHAVVTRDGAEHYVENLSAGGTWVGDAKVGTGRARLKPGDKVRLSAECVLRFEPVAGMGGTRLRAVLVALMLVVLAGGVAAVYYAVDPAGAGSADDDWDAAQRSVDAWVSRQVAARKAPPEASDLFRGAWRLDQAKDFERSRAVWLRLQIVLAAAEPALHCLDQAGKDPGDKALQALLTPPAVPPPTTSPASADLQAAAATAQFVRRRLTYSTKMAEQTAKR